MWLLGFTAFLYAWTKTPFDKNRGLVVKSICCFNGHVMQTITDTFQDSELAVSNLFSRCSKLCVKRSFSTIWAFDSGSVDY